jgi:vacuolar-type H+-ATPase subunit I/STV1
MERNYDEIISEMLRQIDLHSEQLTRQSENLEKQSEKLERQYEKSEAFWREQQQINADLFSQLQVLKQSDADHLSQLQALKQSDKEQESVINQNLELALHTAAILDGIIKRNELKV